MKRKHNQYTPWQRYWLLYLRQTARNLRAADYNKRGILPPDWTPRYWLHESMKGYTFNLGVTRDELNMLLYVLPRINEARLVEAMGPADNIPDMLLAVEKLHLRVRVITDRV